MSLNKDFQSFVATLSTTVAASSIQNSNENNNNSSALTSTDLLKLKPIYALTTYNEIKKESSTINDELGDLISIIRFFLFIFFFVF